MSSVGLFTLDLIIDNRQVPGTVIVEVLTTKKLGARESFVGMSSSQSTLTDMNDTLPKFSHENKVDQVEKESKESGPESAQTRKGSIRRKLVPIQKEPQNLFVHKNGKVMVRFNSIKAKKQETSFADSHVGFNSPGKAQYLPRIPFLADDPSVKAKISLSLKTAAQAPALRFKKKPTLS